MQLQLARPFVFYASRSYQYRGRGYTTAPPSPITTTTFPAPHTGLIKLVLLSSPGNRNAISRALLANLQSLLAPIAAGNDAVTRALVIASAVPGVFCAGADLKERHTMTASDVDVFLAGLRGALRTLQQLPVPTVVAISGAALGGGLELALAADLRVVSPTAVLGLPETRLGIIPGAGGTYRLPSLVGRSRALDLVLTGRRIGAAEAVAIGLASRLVPLPEEAQPGKKAEGREETISAALNLAREMCEGAPLALAAAKRAVTAMTEEAENAAYGDVVGTRDRDEALAAFAEKRRPIFKGR